MSFQQILLVFMFVVGLKPQSKGENKDNDMAVFVWNVYSIRMISADSNVAAYLTDAGCIIPGLQEHWGIGREVVSMHELLTTGFVHSLKGRKSIFH